MQSCIWIFSITLRMVYKIPTIHHLTYFWKLAIQKCYMAFKIWTIRNPNMFHIRCSLWTKLRICNPCNITDYSGDLKSELVGILNGQKEVGLQIVWISNGIWNPEVQPFEIRCPFVKNHFKFGHFIAIAIAKDQLFENRTIWNLTFKKSGFQMFLDFERLNFRSPL